MPLKNCFFFTWIRICNRILKKTPGSGSGKNESQSEFETLTLMLNFFLQVLLRAGCSRDARTKVDKTPLHIAAQEGHADICELLLMVRLVWVVSYRR